MDNKEPERKVDDSEFQDLAPGPADARALRRALDAIAGGGAGGALKEMAQDVLSGRLGLREALNTSAYSEEMIGKTRSIVDRWDGFSEAERERMAAEGERYLAEEQSRIDDERRAQQSSSARSSGARHKPGSWSLY